MAVGSAWTSGRVLAMASDPAAAKAGQVLASLRKWSNLGRGDNLIWGECQGSGTVLYQTKVAPEDPAFSCSCPSRKFPCKHALGLMLTWVDPGSSIEQGPIPPWVSAWVESRADRADAKLRKVEKGGKTSVDPVGRGKREASRMGKVSAGLEDLDLWLGDLVRSGFVSLGSRSKDLWDEQARRMIDAQCPGVARRLRQVDAMSFAGEGWQAALLDRLAQIHLLIEGFRHLGALPVEVAEDVKAAIGFPIDLDAVRAGTSGIHVRDTWQILGQAYALEDKVTVRRTSVWGRDTRRSALILDFSAAGRPFDVGLEPGTAVDATLGLCPGAAPIRALLLDRHAPHEPFGALEGGMTIAEAHAAFGAALARFPWVELLPVVLAEVSLRFEAGSWSAVDPSGAWLPMSRAFDLGWRVEARSGGTPITLVGEFDGSTLNPLGALVAGQFLPLIDPGAKVASGAVGGSPGRRSTPGSAVLTEATASAVVGVERKAPPTVPAGHPAGPIAAGVRSRPAPARLLALAAADGLYARAGRQAPSGAAPVVPPRFMEDRPECSPAAARRLRGLFAGEFAQETNLTTRLFFEWFECCDRAGRRLPANLLADVMGFCPNRGYLDPAVASILGARGRWLARRNPDWQLYGGLPELEDRTTIWETGTKAARIDLLRQLRDVDPAEARRLAESTFAADPAPFRSEVVYLFDRNLTGDDEPFLEAALDDRSRDVRSWAAKWLRRLPGSRLARRMAERARTLLRWDGDRLVVDPPSELDPALDRDGVSRDLAGGPIAGRKGLLLREVLARTPVAAIDDHLGRSREAILAAADRTEWAAVLGDAWEEAALQHRDPAWCRALALRQIESDEYRRSVRFPGLFSQMDADERDALIAARLAASPTPIPSSHPAIRLILTTEGPLGIDLGRQILRKIQGVLLVETLNAGADAQEYFTASNAVFRELFEGLDRKLPLGLVAEAAALLDQDPDGPQPPTHGMSLHASFEALIDRWTFRRDMHQEFAPQ